MAEQKWIEEIAKLLNKFSVQCLDSDELSSSQQACLISYAKEIHTTYKRAGWFQEEAELVGRLLARGWIPPSEAKNYMELADIIAKLDKDFQLAPNDDSYLRLLIGDTLELLRTGKTCKQRAQKPLGEGWRKVKLEVKDEDNNC